MSWALVFVGGGLGAALRHGVNKAAPLFGASFPVGTMTVNIVGSLAMGLLAGRLAGSPEAMAQNMRAFLATGVLGGFTTFSAFSLDALMLYQRGQSLSAVVYVAASVLLSLGAIGAGFATARAF